MTEMIEKSVLIRIETSLRERIAELEAACNSQSSVIKQHTDTIEQLSDSIVNLRQERQKLLEERAETQAVIQNIDKLVYSIMG